MPPTIGGMHRNPTPSPAPEPTPRRIAGGGLGIQTAAHAILLPGDGTVPDWVHLIPAGEFFGRDGRGPYTTDTALVMKWFAKWGMPLVIDYEHQSINTVDNGKEAPAAAWIRELEIRDGETWGRVDWTEKAAQYVASKEYQYLSPVFDYDKNGTVFRLLCAALTNNPNLYLTALNRRQAHSYLPPGAAMDDVIERLCYMLNLPITSTPDEIATHLQRLIDALNAPATAAMRTQLGLNDKAALPELLTAAHARLGAEPDPARYVPKAEFDRVSHSLAELQIERENERVERAVHQAITVDKKVSPAMAEWARAYCRRDPKGFDEYLKSAPVLLPGDGRDSHTGKTVPDPKTEHPLMADAKKRCQK